MKVNRLHLWIILLLTLLIRLLFLGAYPLMDTTEARYGEMARIMVEVNNWVTPQIDYGTPFWGKPPLFIWMSAIGIELFGINEFAVRFPHWLVGVFVVILMTNFARKLGFSGLVTAVVLITTGCFIISTGAMMSDMVLTLGFTFAMIGFYHCWQGSQTWGYLGFVGLAIGLLAKGPLIIVLVGFAVLPWLFLQHSVLHSWKEIWRRIPVISGCFLMLVIALPWYIWAEKTTPGFINYFIVGEHIKRFLISGWEGDLYGNAHDEVRGTIWFFWLYSAAPWSLVLLVLLWKKRAQFKQDTENKSNTHLFLLFWMLSSLIFFTFSGNILPAYVLPSLPAMALLITMLLSQSKAKLTWFVPLAGLIPVLLMITTLVVILNVGERRSDKNIFAKVDDTAPIFYVGNRSFSGQFYSQGKAVRLDDKNLTLRMQNGKLFKVSNLNDQNRMEALTYFQLVGNSDYTPQFIQDKLYAHECAIVFTASRNRSLYKCK